MKVTQFGFLLSILTSLSLVAVGACKPRNEGTKLASSEYSEDTKASAPKSWSQFVVSAKSDDLDITNRTIDGYEIFNRGPLAPSGFERVPAVLFRVFPEVAKAVDGKWTFGEPEAALKDLGFFYDTRPGGENWPIPLGFTWTAPADNHGISYMIRTCASCHVSRVNVNGKTELLEGAGNSQMDFHGFADVWVQFVNRAFNQKNKESTKKKILEIVVSKPVDWFFKGQATFDGVGNRVVFDSEKAANQVKLFTENLDSIIETIIDINNDRVKVEANIGERFSSAGKKAQSHKSGPQGIADSNSNGIHTMVYYHNKRNPDKQLPINTLFNGATKVRIPSVWGQKKRKAAQWTANVPRTFFRNAVAGMGFASNSAKDLNGLYLEVISEYIGELAPPKFISSIDQAKASRGKEVYEKAKCASCHVADHADLPGMPPVMRIGTSKNRMNSSTPGLGEVVVPQLWAVCSGNKSNENLEVTINGKTSKPCDADPRTLMISRTAETTGYPSTPLDGIWVRSPYLHNGSVPTLYHLMAKKKTTSLRPARFRTGSANYDQKYMGWEWQEKTTKNFKQIYDTSLDGFSNKGHEGTDAAGMWEDPESKEKFKLSWNVDNKAESQALDDLLEYMKTF